MLYNFRQMPTVYGELAERIFKNMARLCAACYRPSAIYTEDTAGWPADWEGRTILALVSHWQTTGVMPAYLREIIEEIPSHFNEKGYMREVHEPEIFDEQQLSGHNWLVRGFLEYYLKTGDEKVLGYAKNIVENLYKPLRGFYHTYPLGDGERSSAGSYSGTVEGHIGHWFVSSDIGCAFMCIDALSQYYEIAKDSEVLELLDEMIGVFEKIDFVRSKVQTHATLSATRGIMRLYFATENVKYLDLAKKMMALYEENGMTENYANFNWFGRFDTWTEPCAITDSLMLALSLYRACEDEKYLKLAQRIYYNAFCYAERSNGGFGCDTTVGPKVKYLKPAFDGLAEAFWCCTMRGAEGLRCMAENLFLATNDKIIITFALPASLETDEFLLEVCSKMPLSGDFNIRMTARCDINKEVALPNAETYTFKLNKGETKCVSGSIALAEKKEKAAYQDGFKLFRGNIMLSKNEGEPDGLLRPLGDMRDVSEKDISKENRQIIF